MAKNRQRAKQRQARRAAKGGDGSAQPRQDKAPDEDPLVEDPRAPDPSPAVEPDLAAGAPPEDLGRSDRAIEDEPDVDRKAEEEDEFAGLEPDFGGRAPEGELADIGAPTGHRGGGEEVKEGPRLVQFLRACWAELKRVQWPDRQVLTTLTGVVLGFVLIAGGYLGLLDAIFSRVIQAIL